MIIAGKFICLVLAILYTLSNYTRWKDGQDVCALNFLLQAVSIAGFIVLQYLI
jgi:hypothetical protein